MNKRNIKSKTNNMIIGACGFCSTGSSAVSDYLSEFNENQLIDSTEFTLTYLPDGLEDLEYHLTKNVNRDDNCSVAIPRFRRYMKAQERLIAKLTPLSSAEAQEITKEFLDSIIQMRWISARRSDYLLYPSDFYRYVGRGIVLNRLIPFMNRNLKKSFTCWPNRLLDVSINPDDFLEKSKVFVRRVLLAYGADFSKNIVLDQPFIGNNPEKSFKFFDDPIAIVVDRDPRDNYIFSREFLYKHYRYMPSDNVEEFVKYYRLMRDGQPYQKENKRILNVHFESLVYDYENVTERIRLFCKLTENPRPKSVFDPTLSVNNTQLILRFPQYQKDVEYIEKELPDYLFDFSKYPKPDNSGQMFMGKSPLNKK